MFIAHIPAGYLLGRSLHRVFSRADHLAVLVGSVLPDIDLLLFYFRDGQSVHHHTYLTHRPLIWGAIMCAGLISHAGIGKGRLLAVLGLSGLLHLLLDTIAGAINWGWPIIDIMGPLVVVPASRSHWVLSFLTHWTFATELVLCAVAFAVWRAKRSTKNPGQ